MVETIIDNFGIWAKSQSLKTKGRGIRADNLKLNGVDKLRELILDLAIKGKLIPQDSKDEPAYLLLEKINTIKKRLFKEGKIKKLEPLFKIAEDEKLFEIPKGWEWIRLSDYYDVRDGTHDSPKSTANGYPLVTSKNLYSGVLDLTNVNYISEEDHLKIKDRSKVDKGDVLFAMIGSIGNPVIVDIDIEFSIKNVALFKYYSRELTVPEYLKYFLKNASIKMKEEASGGVQSFVPLGKLRTYLMPLAPLTEQLRIVAKVDELMALCDQLEKQQTDSNTAHEILVETLLETLTNAAGQAEMESAWERIANHFEMLFTTEHSVDRLKQTILQLAVMGKLGPQNPDDEPAGELLKRIEKEKARLVKEGKIKSEINLPKITEDEMPYKLPPSWIWCRMQDLCPNISSGSTPPNQHFKDQGIPYLKVYNIRNQEIDFSYKAQYIEQDYHSTKLKRSILNPGDIIMNIVGPPLGKIAIIPDDYDEWNCNQAIVFFKPVQKDINKWLYTFLCEGTFLSRIELIGTAGQDNISVTKSKNIILPLPPIAEQCRIIAKVDELFGICDSLKERIREAQRIERDLAEAVVLMTTVN